MQIPQQLKQWSYLAQNSPGCIWSEMLLGKVAKQVNGFHIQVYIMYTTVGKLCFSAYNKKYFWKYIFKVSEVLYYIFLFTSNL